MGETIYRKILDALVRGEAVSLRTELNGAEGTVAGDMVRTLERIPLTKTSDGFDSIGPTLVQSEGRATLCEPMLPRERLIVLGGGHIALPLCEFAAKCGFRVTVADDRPAFANRERFPWAQEVVCDSFESSIARLNITPYDYVVIITRGHTHDADCLRAILPGQRPAYLGMIGSRRRVKGLLAMLAEEGYSQERIDHICTPIGLKIGAVTPEEIAVSILSELIAFRRMPEKAIDSPRYVNRSDLDLDILDYLASNHEPKAIVTVIQTKGSTPRGAGAKMAVSPSGDITGSIGGGCSEGAVVRDAIDIIGTGAYRTMVIDMTGDVAESDGMVCGGTMLVLIEDGTEQ